MRNVYENAKSELDVAVFKKKKATGATTTGSGLSGAGNVKAAKYYAGSGAAAGQKQKKQVQSMQ